jgi:uncharacterized membrane protein
MAKNPYQKRQANHQVVAATQTVTHYQGAVPPPEILRGIDEIVPGAAARLIALAEQESNHRRSLEVKTIEANIAAQVAQAQINERQTKAVFRSDMIGQIAGFLVCLCCIGAAVYLGLNGHDWLAGGIAAIPTAALIKAFVLTKDK